MYQALYRKYRPRSFSEVAGQEHITDTLRRQAASGRLSHAYLFVGTRGTGKTTCAKILARAVNCLSPVDGDPCNSCAACAGIENGSILDVLELDAASNNGVDNVRALREEAVFSPAAVKRRVYIVDEVHMLSTAAFNALLKILEEPPEHLLFILATTELHKVPATILSRCQRFSFKRLAPDTLAQRLNFVAEREGLTLTPDAAQKLAALADGSMRDALSLLDQCASDTVVDLPGVLDTIGLAGSTELLSLTLAAGRRDAAAALSSVAKLYDDGKDMTSLLSDLSGLMRDTLVYRISHDSPLLSGVFSPADLGGFDSLFSDERLLYCLETIREAQYSFTRGGALRLTTELCIMRLCDERLAAGDAALSSRIERLEQQIKDGVPAVPPDRAPKKADKPPQPPAKPTPIAEDKAEKSADGDFWADILKLLKSDISTYALLSDPVQIAARLEGAALIIRAASPFSVHTIESKTVSETIRAAAQKVLGHEVTLRAEAGTISDNTDKRDKLDRLSAFDIIKFE